MKKILNCLLAFILCSLIFTGCKSSSTFNTLKSDKTVNIAILGSETDNIPERKDFFVGIKLAIEELKNKGINVTYKVFDDQGSFDTGVNNARSVIKDPNYIMAFTLQSNEIVDTVAKLFDEAKKPLIVVNGCNDETMLKGYNNILNLTLSAENQGKALGKYAVDHGYKWIAVAHSGSKYNHDFAEGFDDSVDESSESKIIDSVGNIDKESKFVGAINRWKTLGVDAVVISYENMDLAMEFVKVIRTSLPNVAILTDSYFNNLSYINQYAQYLQGIVMPSSYPVDSNDRLQKFYDEFEPKAPDFDITSISAQGYDIIKMIVEKLSNVDTPEDFMKAMKAPEGYEGVTGIKFTQTGQLDKNAKYWIIKDNTVYRMESLL